MIAAASRKMGLTFAVAFFIGNVLAAETPTKTIELVFTAPVKKLPPGAKLFPGDVKVSFSVPSLKLEKGGNATVTATIDPPSAEVSFTISNPQIASITSQTSTNGTTQIALHGDADGIAFLRCQSQGHIVYGALRISIGQVAAKKANAVAKKAAAAEYQLFTVSKYLDMSFTPGAEGDFLHGDLVALKAPVDSGVVIPPFKPELVWVGGKWSDYSQYTKIEYITENSGMTAGPDLDFTSEGNGTETISGSGGEGVWFFGFAIWVRVSDGASWYAYTPAAVITATQRITITSAGETKSLEPGDTFEQFNDYMIIRKAPPPTYPPTGIAKTTTPLLPVDGTAKLDGSQSYDNDENGASIAEWRWKFDNLTTPENDAFTVVTDKPSLNQELTTAGEYQITLTVKDNEGELSTPNASEAEVTIKVVGVKFDPATVDVAVGATVSTDATIVPASAVTDVTFHIVDLTIATVDKKKLTASPETLSATGVSEGTTTLKAEILINGTKVEVGNSVIEVTSNTPGASFSPNPAKLCVLSGNWGTQTSSLDINVKAHPPGRNFVISVEEITDVLDIVPGPTQTGMDNFTVKVISKGVGNAFLVAKTADTGVEVARCPVTVTDVQMDVRGRQVLTTDKDTALNGTAGVGRIGAMAVELSGDARFQLPVKEDWAISSPGIRGEFGKASAIPQDFEKIANPTSELNSSDQNPAAHGITVQAVKAGLFDVSVQLRIMLPGQDVPIKATISRAFAAMQIWLSPQRIPDVGGFVVGDSATVLIGVNPGKEPQDFPGIGITRTNVVWDKTGDSFVFVGPAPGKGPADIKAVKITNDPKNPDLITANFFVEGKDLAGNPLTLGNIVKASVLVSGVYIKVHSVLPDVVCVKDMSTVTAEVRPVGGQLTITPENIVSSINYNKNIATIKVKTPPMNHPSVDAQGAGGILNIGLKYQAPGPGGQVASTIAVLNIEALKVTAIPPKNEIVANGPAVTFKATANCKDKIVRDAILKFEMVNAGNTNATITPGGLLRPGNLPGKVVVRAVALAADNPIYLKNDVFSDPLQIEIQNLRVILSGPTFTRVGHLISLRARVFLGKKDVTQQSVISWPNGGPDFGTTAGIYPNIFARARHINLTADSQRVTVEVEVGVPLPPIQPHAEGDFSVDVNDQDILTTGKPWISTRYFSVARPKVLTLVTTGTLVVGINRHIDHTADLHPTPNAIKNNVISRRTQLRIMAFDVDEDAPIDIFVNGELIGPLKLTGTGAWGLTDLDVPTAILNFPDRGHDGLAPVPEDNKIEFKPRSFGATFCVGWVEVSFNAMSPYILVHGKGANGSEGATGFIPGITPGFWRGSNSTGIKCWKGLAEDFEGQGIPFDDGISLSYHPPYNISQEAIVVQADELGAQPARIATEFGTTHINFICHSKGGLDTREWIARVKQDKASDLIIGQVITLDTPHRGSVIADYAVLSAGLSSADIAVNCDVSTTAWIHEKVFPDNQYLRYYVGGIANMKYPLLALGPWIAKQQFNLGKTTDPQSPATIDLQPVNTSLFNNNNFPSLTKYVNPDGSKPTFLAARADADLNGDGKISSAEQSTATKYDSVGYFADIAYLGLRDIRMVQTTSDGLSTILVELPHQSPQKNDFLVTYASAFPIAEPQSPYAVLGTYKKDHGTIADAEVGQSLINSAFILPPEK